MLVAFGNLSIQIKQPGRNDDANLPIVLERSQYLS